jgi:hypothetical protein
LKRRAGDEHKSLGDIASENLRPARAERPSKKTARRFRWRTAPMGPVRVDLGDKEAIRRASEGREGIELPQPKGG